MQVKQSQPAGGITAVIAWPARDDGSPSYQLIQNKVKASAYLNGLRRPCDGYTVPTSQASLYLGGMLSKIEHSVSNSNWTLVHRGCSIVINAIPPRTWTSYQSRRVPASDRAARQWNVRHRQSDNAARGATLGLHAHLQA